MPVYEYECTQCGEVEEVIQKFSEKPLTKCRYCAGKLQTNQLNQPKKIIDN